MRSRTIVSLRFQARPGRGARSVQETGGRTVQIGLGPRVWAGRTCPGRHTPCIAAGTAWRASCVMAEGGSGGVYFERGIEAQGGWRRWVNERWVGVRGSPKRAKSDTAACHPPPARLGFVGKRVALWALSTRRCTVVSSRSVQTHAPGYRSARSSPLPPKDPSRRRSSGAACFLLFAAT